MKQTRRRRRFSSLARHSLKLRSLDFRGLRGEFEGHESILNTCPSSRVASAPSVERLVASARVRTDPSHNNPLTTPGWADINGMLEPRFWQTPWVGQSVPAGQIFLLMLCRRETQLGVRLSPPTL